MEAIKHIIIEDLIARQSAAEAAMLQEFENGSFTLQNPLVRLNPFFICPCAAVVLFKTEKETAVTVTVRGKSPGADFTQTFPSSRVHILPILGLYPDFDNTVDIQLYQGVKKTLLLKTEPAADAVGLIAMQTTAEHLGENLIVVTPAGFAKLTGFDYAGDIRFYVNINVQMGIKKLKNGRLLIGSGRQLKPPYYSMSLYVLDMVGKIYNEYLVPGGYHHDQAEMPDGDLLVLSGDRHGNTVEDVCVRLDRATGAVKKTWDFKDFLTPGEGASGFATEEDWFHNNAVWYDEKTQSITLSGRHIDAMVNIGVDTDKINWILGDPDGWPEDKKKYFFKPESEKEFFWQYAQHACLITPGGDVMCFDNGTLRSKNKEHYLKNKDNFSRAVRYKINTDNMTIEQVWEYGRERGTDFFSQHISNIEYYGEGRYLVHSGGIQFYDGVPAERLLTELSDPLVRRECVTLELCHDKVVLELRLGSNYYRATKLPAYNVEGIQLGSQKARKLGGLGVTEKSDVGTLPEPCGEPLPESCMAHLVEESDKFALKARFERGQNVRLLLAQGNVMYGYDVDTTGGRFTRFSGAPYIQPDDRNTSTSVNKEGLPGTYDVKIIIDGKLYETGIKVTGDTPLFAR